MTSQNYSSYNSQFMPSLVLGGLGADCLFSLPWFSFALLLTTASTFGLSESPGLKTKRYFERILCIALLLIKPLSLDLGTLGINTTPPFKCLCSGSLPGIINTIIHLSHPVTEFYGLRCALATKFVISSAVAVFPGCSTTNATA